MLKQPQRRRLWGYVGPQQYPDVHMVRGEDGTCLLTRRWLVTL